MKAIGLSRCPLEECDGKQSWVDLFSVLTKHGGLWKRADYGRSVWEAISFIPESVPIVLCDVRWLCMILSEDIVRKFLDGKIIFCHLFILYWFRTLHFCELFTKNKLSSWGGQEDLWQRRDMSHSPGLQIQERLVPACMPSCLMAALAPVLSGAGCQWAAPSLWWWRTESCKTFMRMAVQTLIHGGEGPEVQGSCWEGQLAKAQLG